MKVYKKIVLDIESGQVLAEDSFEYVGPIAAAKGQKTTTTISIPPPTQAEKNQQKLTELAQSQQFHDLGYDISYDTEGNVTGLTPRTLTAEEQANKDQEKALQDWAFKRVTGAGPSAEDTALVNNIYGASQTMGNNDIDRFIREIAGQRGLNTSDSPILNAAALGKGQLETALGGARSASLLDIGQRQQNFAESLRQFQEGLNQQKFLNIGAPAGIASNLIGQMAGLRGMQTTTTQNTTGGGFFGELFKGGINAIGQIAAAKLGGSSIDYKDIISQLTAADCENMLNKLVETDLYQWQYKPEYGDEKVRNGPVLELAPKEIASMDGKHIDIVGAFGFLMGAVKALNQRVEELNGKLAGH